ncbi:MAG TPA: hypothetical protein VG225_01285 [Terracidiphilus sp.]|jgi:hypothetical protein|nr:hypothetical protein [Terracidiphilus sp.]
MKFELNLHVLIAHWIPGFLLLMAVRPVLIDGASPLLKSLMGTGFPGGEAITALSLVVAAFLVGEILDASRDLLENIWDRFQGVAWDFFSDAGQDEVEKLRTSFYTYYVFDCNISLALVILLLSNNFINLLGRWLVVCLSWAFLIVFALNAGRLRREIASRTQRWLQSRQRANAA